MTAINFPDSPTVGDQYTVGTRVWTWNGSGWARVINAGQTVSFFVISGPFVDVSAAFPGFSMPDPAFQLLNYV